MPSIDVPCLVPSWVMPAWLSDAPTSPREARQRQRLQTLRSELAAARRVPALPLPPPPAEDAVGSTAEDGGVDLTHSASNAVPFTTGGSAATTCIGASASSGTAAAAPVRADSARQVLPWLFAVEGRLDLSAMETLASQLALSNLQLLDVSRYLSAASAAPGGHWAAGWGSHVRWAGAQALPSPAVAAAAALRRMELRRGGALGALPNIDGKAVVLAYPPQQRQLAAETLALYLHVYHAVSGQEAVEAAGAATGSSPVQATLRSYLEELALLADGWFRRVTLAWPYAGGHVEIVGEAVGGWEQRAPMVFDVKRKRWKLQIWGLPPGIHRFKYLVDGCWVIDLAAHTEADARGNTNNVVLVTNSGKPLLRGMGPSASSSLDEEDEDGPAAVHARGNSPNVLPTAEPPLVASTDGNGAAGQQQGPEGQQEAAALPPPWSSPEEMETMARFGAAVLAFHTRLGLQLRHVMH
ncbi:sucrose nonfermenting 4 isoform X1 [Chlorella sorokiniana]|uniref:Sucrose nonfermenting 4 isoform X1 n=1 Tax=Chlorella sorokiniana TaxID=3076 RepID=A0A2P6TSY4_CHLSO|nr:sucrose nonfermenting 4 isoform X1 [Chlorella sorokiniana]|eukprot:PRW57154.1 sucrose nonfermenting 4 isoform X1 [Chlorella sorokiniana]